MARHFKVKFDTPFKDLPRAARDAILCGTGDEEIRFVFERGRRRYEFTRRFEGVIPNLERRYKETDSEWRARGARALHERARLPDLRRRAPETRGVGRAAGHGNDDQPVITETWRRCSIAAAHRWFHRLRLSIDAGRAGDRRAPARPGETRERLRFLHDVGLDYLTLERRAATLSGGEGQRIRLATQIGACLSGVLYVLDEPSIGLHQRDNARLLDTLQRLKGLGNTVIVVEHDRETILAADHVVDIGPGAGEHGGYLVAEGSPAEIMANPASLTGRYLSGALEIAVPARRRGGNGWTLTVSGARHNNLRNLTVDFTLGTVTCVTGVSGSGKSSLVIDTLYRALAQRLYGSKEKPGEHDDIVGWQLVDKVIDIDQAPIGRTPRSNPATYTGLFTPIRELFAQLPDARVRGYDPGRFSFNVKGGRCEACAGDGVIRIEMHFLPDVYVTCEVCHGTRYNRETLEVRYKGKNIAEVLDLSVGQALEFLGNVPPVRQKLETLVSALMKAGSRKTWLRSIGRSRPLRSTI